MFFSIIDNGAPLFPVFVFAKKVRGGGCGQRIIFACLDFFKKYSETPYQFFFAKAEIPNPLFVF